jgi:hypothetical protein
MFYNKTKSDIRLEVIRLRQRLKPEDRIAIDAWWEKYDKETWKKLNAKESTLSKEFEQGLYEACKVPFDPERNQDRLKSALQELYKFSI